VERGFRKKMILSKIIKIINENIRTEFLVNTRIRNAINQEMS
jgi:hypothetical protein